jgi:hypothetical protein
VAAAEEEVAKVVGLAVGAAVKEWVERHPWEVERAQAD